MPIDLITCICKLQNTAIHRNSLLNNSSQVLYTDSSRYLHMRTVDTRSLHVNVHCNALQHTTTHCNKHNHYNDILEIHMQPHIMKEKGCMS